MTDTERDWPAGWRFPRATGQHRKLHLACGPDNAAPDWIHVDIRPLPGVDLVADILRLPVPDASIQQVVMRHSLEHFAAADVTAVLDEIRRILVPGGTAEFVTPDWEAYAAVFHPRGAWAKNKCWKDWSCMWMGMQDYAENFHYACFAARYLPELMGAAGFELQEVEHRPMPPAPVPELRWVARKAAPPGYRMVLHYRDGHTTPIVAALETAMQKIGWQTHRFHCWGARDEKARMPDLITLLDRWDPDAFVAISGWDGAPPPAMLAELGRRDVVRIGWSHDDPYRFDGIDRYCQAAAPYYDVWCSNWNGPGHLEWFRRRGIEAVYLPVAAQPLHEDDQPRPAKAYDVGFIGTWYAARRPYLEALIADGMDVRLWLHHRGEPADSHWPPPPAVDARIVSHFLDQSAIRQVIRATRVNVDCAEQPDGRVRSAKTRLFEILANGAFALAGRCDQTTSLFREGRDLECYDDAAELVDKARYYLAHAPAREQIAAAGRAALAAGHTLAHRAAVIAGIAERRAANRRRTLDLPARATKAVLPTPGPAGLDRRAGIRPVPAAPEDGAAGEAPRRTRGF